MIPSSQPRMLATPFRSALLAVAVLVSNVPSAKADVVIDGLTGCERATNGRAYCKKRGTSTYVPVTDSFFQKYLNAVAGNVSEMPATRSDVDQVRTTVDQATSNGTAAVRAMSETLASTNAVNERNAKELNKRIGELSGQIELLTKIVGEQREIQSKTTENSTRASIDQTIATIEKRIADMRSEYNQRDRAFSSYLTSIQPNDRDLYMTARKSSEIYPKVPYYIPGTAETGEFWVEPIVTDKGELMFAFKFVDQGSTIEKVRSKIDMQLSEIEDTQKSLLKLSEWSNIAHKNKLRKNYEKRVTCFPAPDCPADGEKLDGHSSTEVRFNVYEDGSTAGRIQRNKGRYSEFFNFSIDSGLLLQAYLTHVIAEARIDFRSGSQLKKELDETFR